MYPLSAKSLPVTPLSRLPDFNGSRSSAFPAANTKLMISPFSLPVRCSLKPKNRSTDDFSHPAMFLKTL
ncbi:hypothetical protein Barb4_03285 [Bacteroidales bacterium Barb4]|nr:hypothetical protein Barb4_03285 [Bacteroidales bacterium Barb4]